MYISVLKDTKQRINQSKRTCYSLIAQLSYGIDMTGFGQVLARTLKMSQDQSVERRVCGGRDVEVEKML